MKSLLRILVAFLAVALIMMPTVLMASGDNSGRGKGDRDFDDFRIKDFDDFDDFDDFRVRNIGDFRFNRFDDGFRFNRFDDRFRFNRFDDGFRFNRFDDRFRFNRFDDRFFPGRFGFSPFGVKFFEFDD